MSLISLDFTVTRSLAAGMTATADPTFSLTTTQRGAIAEAIVAAQLMLVSDGRLSPFRPLADDDGTDLLVMNKVTSGICALQVKARFASRSDPPPYVQFDTRSATFRAVAASHLLAALVDPSDGAFWRAWLIPMVDLETIAAPRPGKLVITPNPSLQSNDRYAPWRCASAYEVAEKLENRRG
jgi:hypothetical protein